MKPHTPYIHWSFQNMIESAEHNIWNAHWGAAVLSMVYLLDSGFLKSSLHKHVYRNIDQVIREHPNKEEYTCTKAASQLEQRILGKLLHHAEECKALGHDVIYSFYILKAIQQYDIMPSEQLQEAMLQIITTLHEGDAGWVTLNGENQVIEAPSQGEAFLLDPAFVLEWIKTFERPAESEQGDMQLGHVLTHAHAVLALQRMYPAMPMARLGAALSKRAGILQLARSLERTEAKGPAHPRIQNPLHASYWEQTLTQGNRHGHRYKYVYSWLSVSKLAQIPADLVLLNKLL